MTTKQRRCGVNLVCRGALATWWFSSPVKRVSDTVIYYALEFVTIAERKPKHAAACCDACKTAIQKRETEERK